MKVVTIANKKGGVGKTAVGCHLGFHFRDLGNSVAVVDLDDQCNASSTLRAYASGISAMSLFQRHNDDDEEAVPAALEPRPGITLIEASAQLTDLERADPQVIKNFVRNLRALAGQFDFVIIDTPPANGIRMTSALIASHFVLSPIELENYSVQGIEQMLQIIFGVRDRWNPGLTFLGMLPNRFNAHSVSQKAALEQLLKGYAHLMITAKIGNRSSIADALGAGVPVWEMPKTAAREAGKEIKIVMDTVVGKIEGERA